MFIRKREYEDMDDKITRQGEMIAMMKRKYENEIDDLKEIIIEYRRRMRVIERLIKKQKETQNYGSVKNTLNKLEAEIKKLEEE